MRFWRLPLVMLGGSVVVLGFAARTRPAAAQVDTVSTVRTQLQSCARSSALGRGRPVGDPGQGSTVALARFGLATVAYVAHEDDRAIHVIDLSSGRELSATPLPGIPSNLQVLADGRVVVALRDRSRVDVLEPGLTPAAPLVTLCSLEVASEPVGLATTPNGDALLVTSGWGRTLTSFDTATGKQLMEVALGREPRAIVVDDDGSRAFVAHVVGATMSVVDLPKRASSDAPAVRSIDLAVTKGFRGAPQQGCQGFALAKTASTQRGAPEIPPLAGVTPNFPRLSGPNGPPSTRPTTPVMPLPALPPEPPPRPIVGRIFAPMVAVDPGRPGRNSGGGYGSGDGSPAEQAMVSVLDAGAERQLTVAVGGAGGSSQDACLLPRAAAFVASKQSLFVACLGSDAVVELDARAVDPARRERVRHRVASGPTGVAIDEAGGRFVVFSQFASKLSILPLGESGTVRVVDVPLAFGKQPEQAFLRGRQLFHATNDLRISADGRACASCHPDGREDALTWSTPQGSRQTPMLAGRLDGTAPFGWAGENATVEVHLEETVKRLNGGGFSDSKGKDDLQALIGYVNTLRAPGDRSRQPSAPAREQIARGEKLFTDEAQGCASCHPGGRSDGHAHAVSSDPTAFDTPSLKGISGTAPYFHDGRFASLEAMLSSPNHAMGKTLPLTRKERLDLVSYLETL